MCFYVRSETCKYHRMLTMTNSLYLIHFSLIGGVLSVTYSFLTSLVCRPDKPCETFLEDKIGSTLLNNFRHSHLPKIISNVLPKVMASGIVVNGYCNKVKQLNVAESEEHVLKNCLHLIDRTDCLLAF